jgi:hypothetical protein
VIDEGDHIVEILAAQVRIGRGGRDLAIQRVRVDGGAAGHRQHVLR